MNPPTHPQSLIHQLQSDLQTRHSLPVSTTWLTQFLSTIRQPATPLPALTSTALFRLLNSDITTSLSTTPSLSSSNILLPRDISNPNTKSVMLGGDVVLQILDILDVGSSRYSQIEAIERVERGEEVKGREVVRVVPIMNDGEDEEMVTSTSTSTSTATATATATIKRSAGPHRLLLQDASGTRVHGFEVDRIPKLFVTVLAEDGGVSIGCKILVQKGTVVRRGMVMLRPEGTVLLDGRVEAWDKSWRGGRKERLKRELLEGAGSGGEGNG